MDGTLSPIVRDPNQAQITPRSRELLQDLQACVPLVAIVTGRSVTDVHARVGLPGLVYVGNHGMEIWDDGQVKSTPEAESYRPAIQGALAALMVRQVPGMLIEDKRVTISVHYRQVTDPDAVAEHFGPIVQQIAAQHGLRSFQGRMVFELRPPIAIDKGSAFRQLVESHQLDAAVYLGDDTTDVDALRMARQMRQDRTCYAVGLGVVADGTPSTVVEGADLLVEGVPGVESFLAWLLNARKASSTCA
jgi:trehalose 6-phosphate phosphatase